MNPLFQILDVSNWPRLRDEQMGSKTKHWCWDQTNQLWLFKFSRPNTGEDWSEKLAAEVAALLGIPHARVELAVCEGTVGSLSLDFIVDRTQCSLVHGNELLYRTGVCRLRLGISFCV